MPKVRIEFDTEQGIEAAHLYVDGREISTLFAMFVGVAGDMPYFVYLDDEAYSQQESDKIYEAIRAYGIQNNGRLG